jgi:hypothetical protein
VGDVVCVREAAERFGCDRRFLSRLLARGDLPTARWGPGDGPGRPGRWIDLDVVAPLLAARRNGNGRGPASVDDPAFRALATAVAHDVVTAALADFRAVAQRLADVEGERAALAAERERLRAEVERHARARRAYETKRAELSAALARVGRNGA